MAIYVVPNKVGSPNHKGAVENEHARKRRGDVARHVTKRAGNTDDLPLEEWDIPLKVPSGRQGPRECSTQ